MQCGIRERRIKALRLTWSGFTQEPPWPPCSDPRPVPGHDAGLVLVYFQDYNTDLHAKIDAEWDERESQE